MSKANTIMQSRKVTRGHVVAIVSDSFVRDNFTRRPNDFQKVLFGLNRDCFVWKVEKVTRTHLHLIAYFADGFTRKTKRIDGSSVYVLTPSSIYINS